MAGETGFLVPPADPGALALALERFLREPELAGRMGAAARSRFEKNFSLKPFADATEKLYGEMLGHLSS